MRLPSRRPSARWAHLPLALVVACGEAAPPPASAGTGSTPSLRVSVRASPDTVGPSGVFTAQVILRNAGPAEAIVPFSSGQRYDLALLAGAGDTLWQWSRERGFIQVVGEERLAPGAEMVWEEPVTAPAAAGDYHLVGWVTSADAPGPDSAMVVVQAR